MWLMDIADYTEVSYGTHVETIYPIRSGPILIKLYTFLVRLTAMKLT